MSMSHTWTLSSFLHTLLHHFSSHLCQQGPSSRDMESTLPSRDTLIAPVVARSYDAPVLQSLDWRWRLISPTCVAFIPHIPTLLISRSILSLTPPRARELTHTHYNTPIHLSDMHYRLIISFFVNHVWIPLSKAVFLPNVLFSSSDDYVTSQVGLVRSTDVNIKLWWYSQWAWYTWMWYH